MRISWYADGLGLRTLDPHPTAEEFEEALAQQTKEWAALLGPGEDRESYLDRVEAEHHDFLVAQLERSERDFREGRFTTWEGVKRRNGLS